jgi:hypothetical protein
MNEPRLRRRDHRTAPMHPTPEPGPDASSLLAYLELPETQARLVEDLRHNLGIAPAGVRAVGN